MLVTGTHEWWLRERAKKMSGWIDARRGSRRRRELGTGLTGVEEIPVTSIFHVC